ncbi:MAG: DUF1800 domain-containing protein [Verrucomicrobia bacterium]|nr:DUF1800 domain-containing protein [Verrucomicrobiota bacterium]
MCFSSRSVCFAVTVVVLAIFSTHAARAAEFGERLGNLSTRTEVGTGANLLVSGFVVSAGAPKKILIRAIGPALTAFAVTGTLTDPVLGLYDASGALLATNDNWLAADAAAMAAVGAFALTPGSRDAALVVTLAPGAYTAQVSGAAGSTGIALLEVYDVTGAARLINLSTRALVGSGSGTLLAGLVIAPGGGPRHLLVRAAGPALGGFGVPGTTADPTLTVLDSRGLTLAANDNWDTANAAGQLVAAFSQSGAFPFPSGSRDAALLVDLSPGNYSIQVGNAAGAAGVALVEVYDLTPATVTLPAGSGTFYVASLRPAASAATSTASGTATLQLSADESSALINVSFSNLGSAEVVAHLVLDGSFILGLPPGQFSQRAWTFAPVGRYSAADLVAALKAGRITVSIDTVKQPTGELTGNFVRNNGSIVFLPPAAAPAADLGLPTPEAASRFLMQATFGPAAIDLTDLAKKGYAAWITEQIALPATPHRAYTMDDFAANNHEGQGPPVDGVYPYPGGTHRQAAWWKVSLTAPDQLRQRVAFALSEIFVVSDQDPTINTWQEGAASYYDTLVANAFGNFRPLLEQVTLHPIMGVYLSMIRNGRATFDPAGGQLSSANENYAREIMQLFTIGLNELNPDGTLRLDAFGQPIPTYTQDTIVETAKVFTGWGFFSTDGARNFRTTGGNRPGDWLIPMMLYPEQHDNTAKTIVGGRVLPAAQGGALDLKDTLDALFNHPNTGPFFSRQLIQRLVTSNPSPGYVYRVARVFADNGAGVRGDLGAVVRAILLDYEARSPALLADVGHGKLKEPLLRATAFLRASGATSDSGRYNIDAYPSLVQAPLRAPTVFNFYLPDYARPGGLAGAGLQSPEFQILTDTSGITMPNFFHLYIYSQKPPVSSADNRQVIYLRPDSLLPLARTPSALVDQLNLLFCAGTLPPTSVARVVTALNALPAITPADDLERVRAAIYLVVNSPDGAIQP